MDQRIINLYDEYTHKPLARDEFLKRLAKLTGSLAAALAVLPLIEVNYAQAAITKDEDLFTETVSYAGVNGEMKAYLARPKEIKPYAAIMVIHENRGLNAHIQDVARRAAKEGFLAIAPDALSPQGGAPDDADKAREMFSGLNAEQNLQNFMHGFAYLAGRNDFNGKYGCVGFCWGGALANQLAVHDAGLKAAVAFYGRQPEPEDAAKIKCPVQLHYGALDERINAGIPAYESALKKASVPYELYVYEGANHAFHNDTAPSRYNEAAAKLAWKRSIEFFQKYLG